MKQRIVIAFSVIALLTCAYLVGNLGAPIHAKSSDPVPDCVAIGKAGASVVSRCEDTDMGKVCYVTTGGFMFCLDE